MTAETMAAQDPKVGTFSDDLESLRPSRTIDTHGAEIARNGTPLFTQRLGKLVLIGRPNEHRVPRNRCSGDQEPNASTQSRPAFEGHSELVVQKLEVMQLSVYEFEGYPNRGRYRRCPGLESISSLLHESVPPQLELRDKEQAAVTS